MSRTDAPATGGVIDVNTQFGPASGAAGGSPLHDLRRALQDHGVRLALASHLTAVWADSETGNRLALEAAAEDTNRIRAVAVVAPDRSSGGAARIAEIARAGAVAFRLERVAWAPSASVALADMLTEVSAAGRPLLVPLAAPPFGQAFGMASMIGELTAGLGVPVVLLGAHYTHIVDDIAAAKRFDHLYLDTTSLAHFRAVETVVRAIGHERLLFGSGAPRRPAQSPLNAVLLASVPEDATDLREAELTLLHWLAAAYGVGFAIGGWPRAIFFRRSAAEETTGDGQKKSPGA